MLPYQADATVSLIWSNLSWQSLAGRRAPVKGNGAASQRLPSNEASSTSTRSPAGAFSSVRVCFCVFTRYVGQLLLAGDGVLRLPTPLTWVFPSCKRKLSGWLWSAWQHNKTRKEKSVWTDKCRWVLMLHGPITIITRLSLLVLLVDSKFYFQSKTTGKCHAVNTSNSVL